MELNRRRFLKIVGLITSGLAIKSASVLSKVGLTEAQAAGWWTGKKWAMVIDTKAFLEKGGSKAAVEACNRVHNVPNFGNPKDEIKWIWEDTHEAAFPEYEHEFVQKGLKDRPILLLCNHCDNPPCTKVCPTQATWQREDGIVMMDYHRCIGCRYCMAACPYGARSFNWRDPRPFIQEIDPVYPTRAKGVVEKCNFCEERLAKGLLPACVEACKGKGLIFGDLNDPNSDVRKALESHYTIRRKPNLGTLPKVYYIV